jgi:hypothetical protein
MLFFPALRAFALSREHFHTGAGSGVCRLFARQIRGCAKPHGCRIFALFDLDYLRNLVVVTSV